ncbi:P-loop containing nucleoside triphosphate hydrolase protein [Xylaria sp. FL1777]|nr:P-loop containing nucleoside triphosphate hydrolase protein [Xylaria sp. FL1777]
MSDCGDATVTKPEGDTPSALKRVLRVDQYWSKQQRQWNYKRTAKVRSKDDRFQKYAIVVRRVISIKGLLVKTDIDIKSKKLANVLLDILEGVEGLELHESPPKVSPEILYHCRSGLLKHLREHQDGCKNQDQELVDDIRAALDFVAEEFAPTIANINWLLEHGEISYQLVWTLFKPETEIFTVSNTLGEPQIVRCTTGRYYETNEGSWYSVLAKIIHHDGNMLGWGIIELRIHKFEGTAKVVDLTAYPLSFYSGEIDLRAKLLGRGKEFLELVTAPRCQEYVDQAVYMQENIKGDEEEKCFSATGRIMVDPAAYASRNPNTYILIRPPVLQKISLNPNSLIDSDLLFCNHRVLGFSFAQKRWGAFAVSRISDVKWDGTAFDKLILNNQKRMMISKLVMSHRTDDSVHDDIIKGKGKGLVGLLSGKPGVGKTLTAEVVAELSQRPLYTVSAGELGTEVSKVDDQLGAVLDIARRWGCILLIDEADVFLYKREEAQLERNALVSVFLRRLEYFQGIVILTTNRRKDIDAAFKSRIHFKFHYPDLNANDRLEIWKTQLESMQLSMGGLKLGDIDLAGLAQYPLNGREIKNAVSCAASIIRSTQEPLTDDLVKGILGFMVDDDEPAED